MKRVVVTAMVIGAGLFVWKCYREVHFSSTGQEPFNLPYRPVRQPYRPPADIGVN